MQAPIPKPEPEHGNLTLEALKDSGLSKTYCVFEQNGTREDVLWITSAKLFCTPET